MIANLTKIPFQIEIIRKIATYLNKFLSIKDVA